MNDCQNLLLFLLSESVSQLAKSVEHLPTVGMLWVSHEQEVPALKGLVLVRREVTIYLNTNSLDTDKSNEESEIG